MKIQRFFSLFFIWILLITLSPAAYAADAFEADARAALLIDVESGETLYEKAAHERS